MKSFRKEHREEVQKKDPDRRNRLAVFLPLAILMALCIQFCSVIVGNNTAESSYPMQGRPVPIFTLPSLENPNSQITNGSLRGTAYLINNFASWCAPCLLEHGALLNFSSKSGMPIIGLAYNDTQENIQAMLDKRGNPFMFVAMDKRGEAAALLGLKHVPTTLAVNEKGIITGIHEGPVTTEILKNMTISAMEDDQE